MQIVLLIASSRRTSERRELILNHGGRIDLNQTCARGGGSGDSLPAIAPHEPAMSGPASLPAIVVTRKCPLATTTTCKTRDRLGITLPHAKTCAAQSPPARRVKRPGGALSPNGYNGPHARGKARPGVAREPVYAAGGPARIGGTAVPALSGRAAHGERRRLTGR